MDKACIYHVVSAVIQSLITIYKKYILATRKYNTLQVKIIWSSGLDCCVHLKKIVKNCSFVQYLGVSV